MNLDFLETLEFQTFAQLADNGVEINKVLELIKNLMNNSAVESQIMETSDQKDLKTHCKTLKKLMANAVVDQKLLQIELAKAKLAPEIREMYQKLNLPMEEEQKVLAKQGLVALDLVVDSTSVGVSFQKELSKLGIIFCSLSEAVRVHPELVNKYLGSIVALGDNYYSDLNSAVFSDGSFCYIPPGVNCPFELSSYFRIETSGTGQFERTLIVADTGSSVSYLEGCTAAVFSQHQLHSAVVELIALDNAKIQYSTIQNWYAGSGDQGGIYNFVTKRGLCKGINSQISWTQVELGSAITWKYPSVVLHGDGSSGEFYSIAVTDNTQQVDTGTKMIHVGRNTRSKIVSKSVSKKSSSNTYRGLVKIASGADNARNYTRCDHFFVESQNLIEPTEIENLKTILKGGIKSFKKG